MNTTESTERQYWLWVTRPEFYLDKDGSDAERLDPTDEHDTNGWWTCHKSTQRRDLIFLWRTSPRKDIGYLLQAKSDAYSIADDKFAARRGWDYACDYQVLYKFAYPVSLDEIRDDPFFDEWPALRARFQRRVFQLAPEYWHKLTKLASMKNADYQEFIEAILDEEVATTIRLEEELEDALVQDLGLLKQFGYDLELYVDPNTGASGRQFVCKGNGGRIDLLCYDRKQKLYVVIELKNVKANQNTFGQISNYVGWVKDRIAKRRPVLGLVISRGSDARFDSALRITDQIVRLDIEQLGFN